MLTLGSPQSTLSVQESPHAGVLLKVYALAADSRLAAEQALRN